VIKVLYLDDIWCVVITALISAVIKVLYLDDIWCVLIIRGVVDMLLTYI
jgi:hypothetical protein